MDCPFRYQGQYEDEETGLYCNRFRFYDSSTGTYLSQDPIGLNGGNATFYSYVSNLNLWIDPLGLFLVYWGTKSDQLPFTPSQRDVQMYNKTGDKAGFSTFKDKDTIWDVNTKKLF